MIFAIRRNFTERVHLYVRRAGKYLAIWRAAQLALSKAHYVESHCEEPRLLDRGNRLFFISFFPSSAFFFAIVATVTPDRLYSEIHFTCRGAVAPLSSRGSAFVTPEEHPLPLRWNICSPARAARNAFLIGRGGFDGTEARLVTPARRGQKKDV
jgi:hypothetical protein